MRPISRVVALLVVCLLGVTFSLSAQNIQKLTNKKIRIDFVGNGAEEGQWWAIAKQGWDLAAEKYGFNNPIYFSNEDPATELANFETAIAAKPDAILLSNVFIETLSPLIPQAIKAGIPVYQIFIVDPAKEAMAPGCGVDWPLAYENMAAQAVAPRLVENGKNKQVINVVWVSQSIDSTFTQLGIEGFKRGLEKAGIKYKADALTTSKNTSEIAPIIENYLQGHRNTDVLVGLSGDDTDRIPVALKDLNYKPGQVLAVGSDILEHAAQGIKDGYMLGAFTQAQYLQTQLAAAQLYNKVVFGFPMFPMKFPGLFVTKETIGFFAP